MRLSKYLSVVLPMLNMRLGVVDGEGGEGAEGAELSSGEAVGTGNDARLALLDQIADAGEGARAEELAHVNDDGSTEPFGRQEPEVAPEEEEKSAEQADEQPKKFKIKVNGKELELTEEEIIERAQKIEAADEYLRQAAEARKKATAGTEEQPPKGPSPEDIQRQQDEEDLRIVRALQMGSEEEALAALRKVRETARGASPSLNRDDIGRTVDERLAFNTAIEKFSTDFSEVWSDPTLKKLAFERDQALLAEGDTRSYSERYTQIGNEIMSWRKSLVDAAAKQAQPTTETKQERKSAAPKVPTSASAKAKTPEPADDDGEEDATSVIAAMREKRGGPQWMRS